MNATDEKKLVALLRKMYALLPSRNGFTISEQIAEAYFSALRDIELSTIERVVDVIIANDSFFPTVARIRELCNAKIALPSNEALAELAWRKVSSALAVACNASVAFDDKGIHFAISAIDSFNGWRMGRELYEKSFCGASYDTHAFNVWRKQFFDSYLLFKTLGECAPYPSFLLGRDNEIVFFGNAEKIKVVMGEGYPARPEDFSFIKLEKDGASRLTTCKKEAYLKQMRSEMCDRLNKFVTNLISEKIHHILNKANILNDLTLSGGVIHRLCRTSYFHSSEKLLNAARNKNLDYFRCVYADLCADVSNLSEIADVQNIDLIDEIGGELIDGILAIESEIIANAPQAKTIQYHDYLLGE